MWGRAGGQCPGGPPSGDRGARAPRSLFPDEERATVAWKWEQECGWILASSGRVSTFREYNRGCKMYLPIILWQLPHSTPQVHTHSHPSFSTAQGCQSYTDSSTPFAPWFPCPDGWLSSTNCHGIFQQGRSTHPSPTGFLLFPWFFLLPVPLG